MPRKMLLWLDFESSGLLEDPISPTMLEVAWCVTDVEGDYRTPVSQAFCALRVGSGAPHVPQLAEAGGAPIGYWDDARYPNERVQQMHEENGLTTEWALINESDPDRIVTSWGELERLLLDDLRDAGVRSLGRHELALAGAGVGHYEHRFLPGEMPRLFGDHRMHYRPHDVSVILSGLRTRLHLAVPDFPGKADKLIETMRERNQDREWAHVALSPSRYDAADRCGYTVDVGDVGSVANARPPSQHWALLERDNHRAAPGITRALMAHRLLPELVQLLAPAPA